MKIFGFKFRGISQAEVVIALVIMSLVILASKNITESKFNYAKRVRAYAAWNNLSKIVGTVVSDGILVEDSYTYKMISPIYRTTENGSYLPNILNSLGTPAVHINGGFYDRIIEHTNVLESEGGKTFTCNGCSGTGYFSDITPTMYLSNGMTLFISPESYSYAMRTETLNNIYSTLNDFRNDLKCLNGVSGVASCNRVAEIEGFCSKLETKATPIAPWSTTYDNTAANITTYFKNVAECPACSNTGQTIKRYKAVQIFEYFHVMFKSLGVSTACKNISSAFLNEAFTRFLAGSYYVVFVDSDGPRSGSNTLNDDVFEFYVLLNGEVLPISSKMTTGDYLLANLYATTTSGVRSIVASGVPLPRAMCHYKFTDDVYSYFSTNFIPIRNYCETNSVECPAKVNNVDVAGCDYIPIRANVSIRGKSK